MPDKNLSERDICTKYITPALIGAGWDLQNQIREEVTFTAGRINVYGKTITRGEKKRADYILYYKNNFPIALIEAKDANHSVSDGIQQALEYAESLDIPFVYSSNGEGFIEHDRLKVSGAREQELPIFSFPSPATLYQRYKEHKGLTPEVEEAVLQDYYESLSAHPLRYFQRVAINRAVEAVARGQNRILLVMATGTGKTYTAFQIIWRLWKARKKKRILFLIDRTALASQTMQGDFRHFGDKMTRIEKRIADPAYEVYIALYQGLTSHEERNKLFKQFSPDFFDLVIVDECHRGSAKENAIWREILDYYSSATQIGLTATPKETTDVSTEHYFGKAIYTYSLKQGIEDGFLAPYKVIRYILDKDIEWRPNELVRDQHGNSIEDRVYNVSDYDRNIVIKGRTKLVARKITEFMRDTDPMQKAIIFCVDIDHAERMREELVNLNAEQIAKNHRYVMRITGDNEEGKKEIENFINPESPYPVLATTSKLLTTGVDVQTCKLIVLDAPINSLSEFKQIIGRGTRVREDFGKFYFTIMDFRGVTRLFADSDFDDEPVKIYEPKGEESIKQKIEAETKTDWEVLEENPHDQILIDVDEKPHKEKIIVSEGVEFNVASRTVQYIDSKTGKLVAESLQDYSKKQITQAHRSLDEFLSVWNKTERKDAIINELLEKGVVFDELKKDVGLNIDEFDLILHIAYGKKPLTRNERAEEVRKKDYFAKYEGRARLVLEALLDKYADQGSMAIDDIGDLNVSPFTELGTPVEIVGFFGGRIEYMEAIRKLQSVLYAA
ncbi:MAG: DEAD/DEAH box helicase family protein [Candidatus Giovannonibacteria bacterium]|nr:DEAD/DEAH box helicase family protein [Candidatus Giovannonibacteria bacterium]